MKNKSLFSHWVKRCIFYCSKVWLILNNIRSNSLLAEDMAPHYAVLGHVTLDFGDNPELWVGMTDHDSSQETTSCTSRKVDSK